MLVAAGCFPWEQFGENRDKQLTTTVRDNRLRFSFFFFFFNFWRNELVPHQSAPIAIVKTQSAYENQGKATDHLKLCTLYSEVVRCPNTFYGRLTFATKPTFDTKIFIALDISS